MVMRGKISVWIGLLGFWATLGGYNSLTHISLVEPARRYLRHVAQHYGSGAPLYLDDLPPLPQDTCFPLSPLFRAAAEARWYPFPASPEALQAMAQQASHAAAFYENLRLEDLDPVQGIMWPDLNTTTPPPGFRGDENAWDYVLAQGECRGLCGDCDSLKACISNCIGGLGYPTPIGQAEQFYDALRYGTNTYRSTHPLSVQMNGLANLLCPGCFPASPPLACTLSAEGVFLTAAEKIREYADSAQTAYLWGDSAFRFWLLRSLHLIHDLTTPYHASWPDDTLRLLTLEDLVNPCRPTLGYLLFGQTYVTYSDTIDAGLLDLLPDSARPAPLLDLPGPFPEVARRLLTWIGAVSESYRPFVDGVGPGCPGNSTDDLWGTAQQLVPFALWGSAQLLYSFYTHVVGGAGPLATLRVPTLESRTPDTVWIPLVLDFPAGSLQVAAFSLTYAPDTGLEVLTVAPLESLTVWRRLLEGGMLCARTYRRAGSAPDSLVFSAYPGSLRVFVRFANPAAVGQDGLLLALKGVLRQEVWMGFSADCRENWVITALGDTLRPDSLSASGNCGGIRRLRLRGGWIRPPAPTRVAEEGPRGVSADPFRVEVVPGGIMVEVSSRIPGPLRVGLYDRAGRRHQEVALAGGERRVVLPPLSTSGQPLPRGLYFVVLEGSGVRFTRRVLLVR